jgi:drug/metabolite transporter (DMT)-like permease
MSVSRAKSERERVARLGWLRVERAKANLLSWAETRDERARGRIGLGLVAGSGLALVGGVLLARRMVRVEPERVARREVGTQGSVWWAVARAGVWALPHVVGMFRGKAERVTRGVARGSR